MIQGYYLSFPVLQVALFMAVATAALPYLARNVQRLIEIFIAIEVYGRDTADARLLTKAGRFVLYRDSGASVMVTRLKQVEHEAYLTMRAGHAGAAVPEIIEAGPAGPAKDALVVYRLPVGTALSEAGAAGISDVTLDDLYRQLLTLRRARIAHGAISGDALLVDPAAETTVVSDFRNATASASPDQLDRDLAGAIAATAVAVGAGRAADAGARSLTPQMLEGALRHLHRPALDPALGAVPRPAGRRETLT